MKIAISQRQVEINGFVYDCLEQGWYHLFVNHEIIPLPNLSNISIDVDMLVLSGGETTEDRLFTLESVACLGCCSLAPAMMIGDDTFAKLTGKEAVKLTKNHKS